MGILKRFKAASAAWEAVGLALPQLQQTDIVNLVYPVGSIYLSTSSANPATFLGVGTWAAWGTGRVPVAIDTTQTEFNTVEKTGGEKTHTLTAAEMPAHSHTAGYIDFGACRPSYASDATWATVLNNASGSNPLNSNQTSVSGGGGAHNNLQPYITCYMWKRTA